MRLDFSRWGRPQLFVAVTLLAAIPQAAVWGWQESEAIGPTPVPPPAETATPDWPETEMVPVRRLVMYNVGVSEVLHFGSVDGNARLKFRVPNEKVDDLLKSFVFRDEAGGLLKSIQYRSAPSLAELAAREFQSPVTLAQLLQMHRGQEIVMEQAGGEIRGVIWGVENRTTDGETIETLVVWVNDQLKSYNLTKLDGIRFTSPMMQQKMKLSLAGMAESDSSDEMRELQLMVAGQGPRRIGFGYLVDSTLWRMTYRLNVGEKTGTLQGWAHIDNSTGQDWDDVDLELRTGRPHVFSVSLFAPLMVTRPDYGLDPFDFPGGLSISSPWLAATLRRSLANQDGAAGQMGDGYYSGGMGGMGGMGMGGMGGMGGGGMGGSMGEGSSAKTPTGEFMRGFMRQTQADATADEERWATEVRYRVQAPVKLKSGESAAIPIMKSELPCRFFSTIDLTAAQASSDSQQVIEVTNQSQLPILGGPVMLQRDGDFLGDVILGRLDVGATQTVAYAEERSLSAKLRQTAEPEPLLGVTMERAIVETRSIRKFNCRLTVTNSDSLPRLVQVTVKLPAWSELEAATVLPAPQSINEADGTAVFEIHVAGNQSELVQYTVAGTMTTPKNLENMTAIQVQSYLANTNLQIDESTRDTLNQWLVLKSKVNEAKGELTKVTARAELVNGRLSDIRRDIELLKFDEALIAPLIEQLKTTLEEKEQISNRLPELTTEVSMVEEQLRTFHAMLGLGQ